MDEGKILYDDGAHKCVMFSFDDETSNDAYLSVNQYLIIQNDEAIVIDPGSSGIFYDLQEAIERYIPVEKIKYLFFSHQDPDVAGSISQWYANTSAKFVLSKLWVRFMSHYGLLDMARVIPLEDSGAKLRFAKDYFHFIPAHFLHAPGNFSLYDSRSKILFSGDIGALIMPVEEQIKEVEDFEAIRPFLEAFHTRYMAGRSFAQAWVEKVRKKEIMKMAPQHGAVFLQKEYEAFLEWFENLECGAEHIAQLYGND